MTKDELIEKDEIQELRIKVFEMGEKFRNEELKKGTFPQSWLLFDEDYLAELIDKYEDLIDESFKAGQESKCSMLDGNKFDQKCKEPTVMCQRHHNEVMELTFKAGQKLEAKKYNPTILKDKIDQARQEGFELGKDKAVATEKKRFEKVIDEIFDEFVFERDECLVDKKGDEMWIELKKLIKNKLGEHNEK